MIGLVTDSASQIPAPLAARCAQRCHRLHSRCCGGYSSQTRRLVATTGAVATDTTDTTWGFYDLALTQFLLHNDNYGPLVKSLKPHCKSILI